RTSSALSALCGAPFSFGASCLASPLVADTFSRAPCTAPPASGSARQFVQSTYISIWNAILASRWISQADS
ncbi:hypothetical protein WOLCODRAFT_139974, partial [Wolfiporia cocos MD-104 SS10]